jgi:hypothetical protein
MEWRFPDSATDADARHGGRLIALYSRGVATVEVSPRGAAGVTS